MTTDAAVEQTLLWVDKVIIGENFCPFARRERENGRIRAISTEETDNALILQTLLDEMQLLENNSDIETTLLIIAQGSKDFFDYLDLVDLANRLLRQEQYKGVFQLATFHPDYIFADASMRRVITLTALLFQCCILFAKKAWRPHWKTSQTLKTFRFAT
jgi:hypothetical protein